MKSVVKFHVVIQWKVLWKDKYCLKSYKNNKNHDCFARFGFLRSSFSGGSDLEGSSTREVWLDVFSSSPLTSVGVGLSDFSTDTFKGIV